jgi:hypothetical protein
VFCRLTSTLSYDHCGVDSCVEEGGPFDVVFHRSDCHDHETDSHSSWTSPMLLTKLSLTIVAKLWRMRISTRRYHMLA